MCAHEDGESRRYRSYFVRCGGGGVYHRADPKGGPSSLSDPFLRPLITPHTAANDGARGWWTCIRALLTMPAVTADSPTLTYPSELDLDTPFIHTAVFRGFAFNLSNLPSTAQCAW